MCGQCHQLHCQLTPSDPEPRLDALSRPDPEPEPPPRRTSCIFFMFIAAKCGTLPKLKCRVGQMGQSGQIALTVSSLDSGCGWGNGYKSMPRSAQRPPAVDFVGLRQVFGQKPKLLWPTVSQSEQTKTARRRPEGPTDTQTMCAAPVLSGLAGTRLCTRLYAAPIQFLQMRQHDCMLQILTESWEAAWPIEKFLFQMSNCLEN